MTPQETTQFYQNSRLAQNIVVAILCMGVFVGPLMLASVNVALPSIAKDLETSARQLSWVSMAFILSNVVFLLPIGKFADQFGRKKVFFIGISIMLVGCVMAAIAENIISLLASRIIQGFGAAMVYGTSMAITTSVVSEDRRGSALGLVSASVFISLTISPFLGGVVTDNLGWRYVFLIPIPVGIFALALGLLFMKGDWKSDTSSRFDTLGTLNFALITCIFIFGISNLPSVYSFACLFISAIFSILFIRQQLTVSHGIVNLPLLRTQKTFRFAILATLFMYASNFGINFLLSLYLQYIGELSASKAGSLLVYQALMMATSSVIAGQVSDRMDARYLSTLGCIITVTGYAWLALMINGDTPLWHIVVSQMLVGFGFGFFTTPNNSAAMGSVDKSNLGSASAMINLSRNIGNLMGMSVVMLLISIFLGSTQITEDNYDSLLNTIKIAMLITVVYSIIGALFTAARGNSKPQH